ncbi:sialic acid binding lectin [Elysia marginata]|uniref:Sialic acid binding lectin n=1 Tax=Elysia marginata TaxID=1093978 RepID=A0AAV4K414_9GAST|nr:sialic acid binding lectin [Elysia marginata]
MTGVGVVDGGVVSCDSVGGGDSVGAVGGGDSVGAGVLYLDLYKNQEYISSAYAHVTSDCGSASNAVVVTLKRGDQVYVTGYGSSVLSGDPWEVYYTFSGYQGGLDSSVGSGLAPWPRGRGLSLSRAQSGPLLVESVSV